MAAEVCLLLAGTAWTVGETWMDADTNIPNRVPGYVPEGIQVDVVARLVGGVRDPVCDPCVATICTADPYCCNTMWDAQCVLEVNTICGLTCPKVGHPLWAPNWQRRRHRHLSIREFA